MEFKVECIKDYTLSYEDKPCLFKGGIYNLLIDRYNECTLITDTFEFRFDAKILDTYFNPYIEPKRVTQAIPKFKPLDYAWFMYNNGPIYEEISCAIIRNVKYFSGEHYNVTYLFRGHEKEVPESLVFSTKQELIKSL